MRELLRPRRQPTPDRGPRERMGVIAIERKSERERALRAHACANACDRKGGVALLLSPYTYPDVH